MSQSSRVYVARWLSYERTEHGVLFQAQSDAGDPLQVEITTLEPAVVRLRMAPGQLGAPNDRLLVPGREAVSGSILSADQGGLTLSSSLLRLRVSRDPWCVSLTNLEGGTIASQAVDDRNILGAFEVMPLGWEKDAEGASVRVYDALALAPDERFFGFGERFVPLDQRGRSWKSWTEDAFTTSTQRSYKPVPFGMSSRGYGLFINTTAPIDLDLGASSSLSFGFSPAATELDYFMIYGPALNDVLRRYWRLTGTPPLPPYWSFGFWTSRFGYENRAEVEAVARGYRERGIPCDVIHLDPQWMGGPENWCDLEWDTGAFPDPKGMIGDLRDQGFRVCLWVNSYVPQGNALYAEGAARGYFVRDDQGEPYFIPGWTDKDVPLAVVDFTNPEAVAWWKAQFRRLMAMGVATFKTDFAEAAPTEGHYHDGTLGTEAHNLYPLLYNRAVFEAVDAESAGQGVVWARSTTAGGQRYPVHWGGDSRTTFDHMASSLRGGLNFLLSGFAYWSHDIGGFSGESDPALYARWAQMGLFSSHSRAHGTSAREPWAFGADTEAIFKTYAELRYRLLPYIISCAARASSTGRPLMRPLVLDYQDDPTTHTLDLQYLFGEAFLVAPVFAPVADVPVYLPEGRWIDYWSKHTHVGPCWIEVHAELDRLPLFVREGSIVPMGPLTQYVGEKRLDPLTLDVYPADAGAFTVLGEDSGPVELRYRMEREELVLQVEGYHGRIEAILNLVPGAWDVRVNGRKCEDWEMQDRRVVVRFSAEGSSQVDFKFDL